MNNYPASRVFQVEGTPRTNVLPCPLPSRNSPCSLRLPVCPFWSPFESKEHYQEYQNALEADDNERVLDILQNCLRLSSARDNMRSLIRDVRRLVAQTTSPLEHAFMQKKTKLIKRLLQIFLQE